MAQTITKKNYIKGSAKSRVFDNGGTNVYLSLLFDDLAKLPRNEDGYIRLVVSEYREADKYGNTHTVYENDWKPDANYKAKKGLTPPGGDAKAKATPVGKGSSDDLPF